MAKAMPFPKAQQQKADSSRLKSLGMTSDVAAKSPSTPLALPLAAV